MLDHICEIGRPIRKSYYFLADDVPVYYLFIDNAGSHRKIEVKIKNKQHEQILQHECNIFIEWKNSKHICWILESGFDCNPW